MLDYKTIAEDLFRELGRMPSLKEIQIEYQGRIAVLEAMNEEK